MCAYRAGIRLTHCPNCGRYIGPVDRCPYCLRPVPRPSYITAFRYGTVALALLLVLVMWQWAVYNPPPHINIGAVSKSMNYARITIKGMVSNGPYMYESDYGTISSIYFYIDDGTGEIKVVAYETTAKEMVNKGVIPGFGDKVEIKGANVIWRGGDVKVIVSSTDQINIIPRKITEVTINDLYSDENLSNYSEGEFVRVCGIIDYDISDKGSFYLMRLRDNVTDTFVDIYLSKNVVKLTGIDIMNGTLADLKEGAEICVVGALKIYIDRWEIIVTNCMDIAFKGNVRR